MYYSINTAVVGGTRGKLHFKEAQACLDEVMSLPIPFQLALTSGGSAAQTSNDLVAIENARSTLSDLIKVVLYYLLCSFFLYLCFLCVIAENRCSATLDGGSKRLPVQKHRQVSTSLSFFPHSFSLTT